MKKLFSILLLCIVLLFVNQDLVSKAEASGSHGSEMGSNSRTQPDIPSED
ncbi:hypothetical protein [Bacillus sp. RO1]|nr:hypothetical protein [Bacillus sp. RO1]NLP52095.1 hypothetical protein [Bacillus sp. RO1]